MTNTFTVRSIAQKTLFVREINGQLSDGQWENLRPMDHWRPWSEAEVVVAPEGGAVGHNFRARDSYDLLQLAKNDIVRARMLTDVKVVLTFGEQLFDLIIKLYDSIGNWKGMPDRQESVTDEEDKIYLQLSGWRVFGRSSRCSVTPKRICSRISTISGPRCEWC